MGLTVTVDLPPIDVEISAAIQRGLLKGGRLILAEAVIGAPKEPTPKHGVHLAETGYVRLEGETAVEAGFEAYWALWQETDDNYHHETGHAHFTELAFVTKSEAALELVAAELRALGD